VTSVAERLRILAGEAGLSVVSAASSLRLNDQRGAVVLLYPTYRSVEFPLNFLWQAGREAEISELRDALQQIAGSSKKVSAKVPNIGCREALTHWTASPRSCRAWSASGLSGPQTLYKEENACLHQRTCVLWLRFHGRPRRPIHFELVNVTHI
jgi:hypothetical protein